MRPRVEAEYSTDIDNNDVRDCEKLYYRLWQYDGMGTRILDIIISISLSRNELEAIQTDTCSSRR